MARRVFFSFHYQRDIWRVNQIRNIGEIVGSSAAGFHDCSLWEEAESQGEAAVKALIDEGLKNTSVTVVCIGNKTAGRKYINYEISESIAPPQERLRPQLRRHFLPSVRRRISPSLQASPFPFVALSTVRDPVPLRLEAAGMVGRSTFSLDPILHHIEEPEETLKG